MAHRLVTLPVLERRRLAGLARNPSCRISKHTRERPCEWNPMGTATPADPDYCFTVPGAWAFLAEHLESGADVYTILLEQPSDRLGYVIFCPPTATWKGL